MSKNATEKKTNNIARRSMHNVEDAAKEVMDSQNDISALQYKSAGIPDAKNQSFGPLKTAKIVRNDNWQEELKISDDLGKYLASFTGKLFKFKPMSDGHLGPIKPD